MKWSTDERVNELLDAWRKGNDVSEFENEYLREHRNHNIGKSNYAQHKIQPWDIWLEYDLNPWDADIVKRVLRKKDGDSREMDYEKIIHIRNERIRQIKENDE